jgi:tRNA pseudouridine(55) synthase
MSRDVKIIYKKIGQTPLESIQELKKNDPKIAKLPMTYAGRLDPLAEGLMIILIGEKCKEKESYLKLGKVYEVDVLFGFSTDTYDLLGKVNKYGNKSYKSTSYPIDDFVGQIDQEYPVFSSKTVNGKPLFVWAKENKLKNITIPRNKVIVKKILIDKKYKISGKKLQKEIHKKINLVHGDFRQKEILKIWDQKLKNKENESFTLLKIKIFCGSGVYARYIANKLGEKIDIPALAFNIKRIQIGKWKLK